MKRITREKREKGITLVALVVTIVVLLILAGVSINLILGQNGLIAKTRDSAQKTQKAANIEQQLVNGKMQIDGVWYDSIDDYLNGKPGKPPFDAEEWDKKSAPEDVFIWQSDDKNDEGYGIVVGYNENVQNYSTLRYPSRCTKVTEEESYISSNWSMRTYTNNIKEIELPDTVVEIGTQAFSFFNDWGVRGPSGYYFDALEKITIPGSVRNIGDYAFAGDDNLKSVIIEEGVTSIGDSAFCKCNSLTSIVIPDSVTTIKNDAFYCCENLANITIGNSVTNIGDSAFYLCTSLTNITIPDSITTIGKWAFQYCRNLTNVTIPDSVVSIGKDAFREVPHIYINLPATGEPWGAGEVVWGAEETPDESNQETPFDANEWDKKAAPEDVFIWQSDDQNDEGYGVVVGYNANVDNYSTLRYPSRCTKITVDNSYIVATDDITTDQIRNFTKNIKEIELPETVNEIGKNAFGNESTKGYIFSTLEKINIPNNVKIIGESAFYSCESLSSITIPRSVTSIGSHAFWDCSRLTSITIPRSVTSIGSWAFVGCDRLTSITIPRSVTNIGNNAFSGIPTVYYSAPSGAPWGASAIN